MHERNIPSGMRLNNQMRMHRLASEGNIHLGSIGISPFKVPKLDILIRTSSHESLLIESDVHRPNGAGMCFDCLNKRRRRQVIYQNLPDLGTDCDLQEVSINHVFVIEEQRPYMSITREECAADGMAAFQCPNTRSSFHVPNLQRA